MRFLSHKLSNEGGRTLNEDYCGIRELEGGMRCWVVADGLGGHVAGEVASQTAVEAFLARFEGEPEFSPNGLRGYLDAAQQAVWERQNVDTRLYGMRTTIVALLTNGSEALWAHIGDTRLYLFRDGTVVFQTKDHSVPQAMADAGEIRTCDIRYHEDRNRLLRDIGGAKGIRPCIEAVSQPLISGDVFLLCTDGFWEYITETEMAIELSKSTTPEDWLINMELRLRKNARVGSDNYSAIGIFVEA